jgi:hypothetical protein
MNTRDYPTLPLDTNQCKGTRETIQPLETNQCKGTRETIQPLDTKQFNGTRETIHPWTQINVKEHERLSNP